jgi:hypothetical protein
MPWWAAFLALAAGISLGVPFYRRRVRVAATRLTPDAVLVRTWSGRTVAVPRSAIAEVVLVEVHFDRSSSGRRMLFVGHDRRCLARANMEGISWQSLRAFARQLGVPVSEPPHPYVGWKKLREQYPGSASWLAAHPGITVVLVTLGFLAVVAVGWALSAFSS